MISAEMSAFKTNRDKRETVIRSSLINNLKDSIQGLICGPGGENVLHLPSDVVRFTELGNTNNTNALCSVLEAILIHGLKDSLSDKLSSMFQDVDRMPVPNIWLVIMIISHRDLIEQVSNLSFIMTDVGKARAWLRLALNQGQLTSYLDILTKDSRTLKDYYRPTAFLRDPECCDIFLRILQPMNGVQFELATNSSMLNTWSQIPLILSGTWVPAKIDYNLEPVLSATDVASTFLERRKISPEIGIVDPNLSLSDRMFDMVICGTPETNFIEDHSEIKARFPPTFRKVSRRSPTEAASESTSTKLLETSGTSKESPPTKTPADISEEISEREVGEMMSENIDDASSLSSSVVSLPYDRRKASLGSQSIDYKSVLSNWEQSDKSTSSTILNVHLARDSPQDESPVESDSSMDENGFQLLSSASLDKDMTPLVSQLIVLANEKGLDQQNYICNGPNCSVPIGMIYGVPKLCKFDGKYYCTNCHEDALCIIPARVIHNWDFASYSVCRFHKDKLEQILIQPILNLREMKPSPYRFHKALAELHVLRIQLHFMQAYLFTCHSNKGSELRKAFWPREHLYEHVHLYSIQDLKDLYDGKLVPLAQKWTCFARKHIQSCQTCYMKGFICELCHDDVIIFPFDSQKVFNCSSCHAVFHKRCLQMASNCPKCQRLLERRRQSVDLLVETEPL